MRIKDSLSLRAHVACILMIGLFLAEEALLCEEQVIECPMDIYLYLDTSGSLSAKEKRIYADSLVALLAGEETIFPDEKKIYIIPFAEVVQRNEKRQAALTAANRQELKQQIDKALGSPDGVGSTLLSDLKSVFSDIALYAKSRGPSSVFVIASDFEHDITNRREDIDLRSHQEDWLSYWKDNIGLLRKRFGPDRNQVLLLLDVQTRHKTFVSTEVLSSLSEVVGEDRKSSLYFSSNETFDPFRLLQYLQPLQVKVIRTGSPESKDLKALINVKNTSCNQLTAFEASVELKIGASDPREYIKNIPMTQIGDPGAKEYAANVRIINLPIRAEGMKTQDLEIHVYVYPILDHKSGKAKIEKGHLASGKAHMRDFLFLSSLRGMPHIYNRHFHIDFKFLGELEGRDTAEVQIGILVGKEIIATQAISIDKKNITGEMPLAPIDIKIARGYLSNICANPSDLYLHLDDIGKSQGLLVQGGKDLPLKPGSLHDGDTKELLKGLFQQGSLPIFITLIAVLLLLIRKNYFDMGKVEELFAVIAVGATTAIIILHDLTSAEGYIDNLLTNGYAKAIGASILVLLSLLIMRLFQTGTLPVAQSVDEISAEMSIDDAYTKPGLSKDRTLISRMGRRLIFHAWRRVFVPVGVVAGLSCAAWVALESKERIDCWISFSDDIAAHKLAVASAPLSSDKTNQKNESE